MVNKRAQEEIVGFAIIVIIVSVILFILSSEFLISIYGNHGLWLSLLWLG